MTTTIKVWEGEETEEEQKAHHLDDYDKSGRSKTYKRGGTASMRVSSPLLESCYSQWSVGEDPECR